MRACPICRSPAYLAPSFLKQNYAPERITSYSFASRKTPEFMNHELVKCNTCELVFALTPPGLTTLHSAYHQASYDSSLDALDAAQSYADILRPIIKKLTRAKYALEIGCGNGVLLDRLAELGFDELIGIEPSKEAIRAASPKAKTWIHEGVFEESQFAPNTFDLICCMMTMEHVHEPQKIAQSAIRLLRPGGAFVTVTHDYRSLVNRLMGKKSPIIDIEHLQLFNRKSIHKLFEDYGFLDIEVADFHNTYSVKYWLKLSPIPTWIKLLIHRPGNRFDWLSRFKLSINVGNIATVGFKPL